MTFLVIPAVDIQGGRCVRLVQGDYDRSTVFDDDPVHAATRWQDEGAEFLHVVDLDGAASGQPANAAVVASIVRSLRIKVEVTGGIRTLTAIESLLDLGAHRVILGTVAVEQPDLVSEACARWGERIVLGLDVRGGRVATRGWKHTSTTDALTLGRDMVQRGIRRIISTDIERDGTLSAPNVAGLIALMEVVRVPVIASGGVSSSEHIRTLARAGAEGAVIGRALYDGTLSLGETLQVAQETVAC